MGKSNEIIWRFYTHTHTHTHACTCTQQWACLLFSRSVMSDSLQPHGLQHARLPCPSPTPGACSNSCPSSRWCHPTISSSVIPVSSCPQSFPASGSSSMSQFFASGGQSIGASALASVLPMNIQDRFPSGLTGLISLQPKGLLRILANTPVQKHQTWWTWCLVRCEQTGLMQAFWLGEQKAKL